MMTEPPEDVEEYLEATEEMLEQAASLMLEAGMLIEEMETREDIDDYLLDGETVTVELDRNHLHAILSIMEQEVTGMNHPVAFYSNMQAFRSLVEQHPDLMEEALEEARAEQEQASRGFW